MRIPTSTVPADTLAATARSSETSPTDASGDVASANNANATPVVALQSAVLKPAMKAMKLMPDVDEAKVAQLRDAISNGTLPSFDPGKLAGLIQRFHGSDS
jgi:negative regulator of flagellin synthesis FlgM